MLSVINISKKAVESFTANEVASILKIKLTEKHKINLKTHYIKMFHIDFIKYNDKETIDYTINFAVHEIPTRNNMLPKEQM